MKFLQRQSLSNYFFIKSLKPTLRFVALVATPLCLVNSFIASYESADFLTQWINNFASSYLTTYPQAVVYVSLIKWFDSKRIV